MINALLRSGQSKSVRFALTPRDGHSKWMLRTGWSSMALGATPRWLWKKSKKAIPVTSTMTVPATFWKPVVGGMPMRDSSAVRADSNEEAYCEEHAPEHSEEGISASIVVEGFAGSARMRWKSRSLSSLMAMSCARTVKAWSSRGARRESAGSGDGAGWELSQATVVGCGEKLMLATSASE